MYERDIRDSADRIFDTCFIYYGKESLNEVSEYEVRNHIFKARDRISSDIPKDGAYIMPEEFFGKVVPYDLSIKINSKFRNVQYIEHDGYLYWIYVLSSSNLYKFKFIGDNMSDEMLRALMQSSGYVLGYKHRKEMASLLQPDRWIEVWFHPTKLHVAVFEVDMDPSINYKTIHDKMVLYKKFEGYSVESTNNTFLVFYRRERYITVPFITTKYPGDKDGNIYWTKYIKPTNGWFDEDPERVLTTEDIKKDSEYFMKSDYDDFMKLIFNKE